MRSFVVIIISFAAVDDTYAKSCSETAQTQSEMKQCADIDFKAADMPSLIARKPQIGKSGWGGCEQYAI